MRCLVAHSKAGKFLFPVLIGFSSLIMVGKLKASDPGQVVWKEQRGSMKSAEIGVVVWKEQPFHNDAASKAFVFERMRQAGPVTWFYNKAVNVSFEQHQPFQLIRFPQWPVGEIVQQEEFESLKFNLEELEAFAKRYPNAEGFLKGVIGSMRDAVSKFSSGNVFFSGNWITRQEHEKLIGQRNEMLKKYKLEREELERKFLIDSERNRQSKTAAIIEQWSIWIQVAGLVWLLLLVLALLTKSWAWASFLVVSLAAVAGWFTYAYSGFGWTEHVLRALQSLPTLFSYWKE